MIFIVLLIVIVLLYLILNKTKLSKYNPKNLTFCIIICVLFSIVQGFRAYSIGNDTLNYVKIYNSVKTASLIEIIAKTRTSVEMGFQLLLKMFAIMHVSDRGFLLIIAIMINIGVSYFIYKNSKSPLLSIIIFMGTEFFNLSFTALRQMLAVSIIINTYPYLVKKEKLKPICLILVAATLHRTAIIFMIALVVQHIKLNKKTYTILGILFVALHLVGIPILYELIKLTSYGVYLKTNVIGEGVVQTAVIIIYTVFGIYLRYKNGKKDEQDILVLLMIIAIFIQSITYKIALIGRLIWYFYIFNTIFLPNLIMDIKDKKIKNISYIVIATLNIMQYLLLSMNMYNVTPYAFLK